MHKKRIGNWYFGWNIVIAASLLTLLTSGLRMSIGTFFLPIIEDLHFSRSVFSFIVAIGMLFYGIAMPIAGYLVNRYGTRNVLLLGTGIISVAAFWSVNATSPLSFLLSFGITLSFGTACVSAVSFTQLISQWFTKQRGLALVLLTTGSMAGIAIMLPIFTFLISLLGWKLTLMAFSVVFALIAVPVAFLIIREKPQDEQAARVSAVSSVLPELSIVAVFKTWPFWQICVGLFACGFSMNLIGTHGIPMLIDHGFDQMTSAYGIGMIGLVAIFSTVFLGYISDLVPRRYILASIYLVRGFGFIGLMLAASKWQLFTVAIIGGCVWAGSVSLSSAITADIYGVKLVGILSGLAYVAHQVGAMISTWLGGVAYEIYHTHWIAFGSATALLFIAAIVVGFLPDRKK